MNHDSIHAIQLFGSTKYFRLTWVSRKGNLKFDALSACVPLDFFIGIIHLSSDTPIYLYIILYYIIYIILYYIILYIIYIYSISCCKNSHDVPICDLPSVVFFFGGFLQQPQFIQHPTGVRSLQRILQDLHLGG